MYHTRIIPTPFREGAKQPSPPPKQENPQAVSKDMDTAIAITTELSC